ncbi:hypothetical protein EPO34_01000 [Patescibacteria group bacterium]|nr:MAG: hypothetical protein EPO34_01000 [Patescibacteria group bacterium]
MRLTVFRSAAVMAGVFLIHLLLSRAFDMYDRFPNFDIPMHFIGGFVAGMVGIALHVRLSGRGHARNASYPVAYHALFVLGIVMAIAVGWEFHEFVLDWYNREDVSWRLTQPSIADTMLDLLMGAIGGLMSVLAFRKQL